MITRRSNRSKLAYRPWAEYLEERDLLSAFGIEQVMPAAFSGLSVAQVPWPAASSGINLPQAGTVPNSSPGIYINEASSILAPNPLLLPSTSKFYDAQTLAPIVTVQGNQNVSVSRNSPSLFDFSPSQMAPLQALLDQLNAANATTSNQQSKTSISTAKNSAPSTSGSGFANVVAADTAELAGSSISSNPPSSNLIAKTADVLNTSAQGGGYSDAFAVGGTRAIAPATVPGAQYLGVASTVLGGGYAALDGLNVAQTKGAAAGIGTTSVDLAEAGYGRAAVQAGAEVGFQIGMALPPILIKPEVTTVLTVAGAVGGFVAYEFGVHTATIEQFKTNAVNQIAHGLTWVASISPLRRQ